MQMQTRRIAWSVTIVATGVALGAAAVAQRALDYPGTRKIDHVDTYHGTQVADPYRWLEDDNSAETAEWVQAQNAVTFRLPEQIPYRKACSSRLDALYNYPKYSAPSRKGDLLLLLQERRPAEPERALHAEGPGRARPRCCSIPNTWSDGRHRAAGRVRAVEGRQVRGLRRVEERLGLAGIPGPGAGDEEAAARQARVGEGLGRRVGRRRLLLQPLPEPGQGHGAVVGEREPPGLLSTGSARRRPPTRWCSRTRPTRSGSTPSAPPRTSASRSSPCRTAARARRATPLFVRTSSKGEKTFSPVIPEIGDDSFNVLDNVGDKLLVLTDNRRAERPGRARSTPSEPGEANWRGACPSGPSRCRAPARRGGKLFATYLKDVATAPTSTTSTASSRTRSSCPGSAPPAASAATTTTPSSSTPSRRSLPADDLPLRHRRRRPAPSFRAPAIPGFDAGRVRDQAGVLHQQGRHQRPDVPGAQEGPEAGRQQPDAAVRLRRVQHHARRPAFSAAAHRPARAGLRLRVGQHARRRRVRRGVARGRHEAEEAERVRRLHRRGRVADRQQVHVAGAAGDPGRLQRRPAGGRRHQPAARAVPRRPSRRSA